MSTPRLTGLLHKHKRLVFFFLFFSYYLTVPKDQLSNPQQTFCNRVCGTTAMEVHTEHTQGEYSWEPKNAKVIRLRDKKTTGSLIDSIIITWYIPELTFKENINITLLGRLCLPNMTTAMIFIKDITGTASEKRLKKNIHWALCCFIGHTHCIT